MLTHSHMMTFTHIPHTHTLIMVCFNSAREKLNCCQNTDDERIIMFVDEEKKITCRNEKYAHSQQNNDMKN